MTLFGIIKTRSQVQQAVIDHLQGDLEKGGDHAGWMTPYLAEVERQMGLNPKSLPPVRAWVTANEFRKMPEEQIPVGVVVSPGLSDRPVKDGSKVYTAKWHIGIAIVVKGRDKEETGENAGLYAAACRGAMLQHQSLGGFAKAVDWLDEDYTNIKTEANRTLGSAQLIFEIEVGNTIQTLAGLVTVPEDPYDVPDSWPTAEKVTVDVEQLEEDDDD